MNQILESYNKILEEIERCESLMKDKKLKLDKWSEVNLKLRENKKAKEVFLERCQSELERRKYLKREMQKERIGKDISIPQNLVVDRFDEVNDKEISQLKEILQKDG